MYQINCLYNNNLFKCFPSHSIKLNNILQGILWPNPLNENFLFGFSLVFLLIFIHTLIRENGNRTLDRTMACSGNGAYDCLTNEMEKEKVFLLLLGSS